MKASLGQVFLAVRAGDIALVGEVAGYIVLGAADRAIHELTRCDWGTVAINETGEVTLHGSQESPLDIERDLRSILGWLLDEVRSPFPNLRRVAERNEARGLKSLVTELETALVPVNRRAAARSLSRLCREAVKSAARQDRAFAALPVAPTPSERRGGTEPEKAVLVERLVPVIERDRRSERVEADEVPVPDSEDEEPTLVRASYSEPPPAPEERLAPPQDSLLPPPVPEADELEFDVEFEDFELSRVAPEPLGGAGDVRFSATESVVPPSLALAGASGPPSTSPGSSRYRSVLPGAESYAPLIWDSSNSEAISSDISSLLSALRRDSLPSDQLYRALSLLSDGEGACANSSVGTGDRS